MIRCILFDLDGVLVDAGKWHYDALNLALQSVGAGPIFPMEHESVFNGLPTKDKLAKLMDMNRINPEHVETVRSRKQEITEEIVNKECKFDPEKFCLLAGLKEKRFNIGLVTNAKHKTAMLICGLLGIAELIDVYTTNEDGICKPSPDLYRKAIDRFWRKPSECLAIEDCHYGIDAAEEAGCLVLPVKNPSEVTPTLIWKVIKESHA